MRRDTAEPSSDVTPALKVVGDEATVDLHGFYPQDVNAIVPRAIEEAWERNARTLRIIHGHGRFRQDYALFANTNTGPLGLAVRGALRENKALRQWMYAKIDCSAWGATTVRLRAAETKPMQAERQVRRRRRLRRGTGTEHTR